MTPASTQQPIRVVLAGEFSCASVHNDALQQLGSAFAVGALGQLFADGAKQAQEKQQGNAWKQPAVQVTQAPALPQKDFEFGL